MRYLPKRTVFARFHQALEDILPGNGFGLEFF
jgi:hypothetical protein